MNYSCQRRQFLQASAATLAAASLSSASIAADAKPQLKKAVKIGMIGAGKTFEEKFELIKRLGFEGVEMNSPSGDDRQAAKSAAEKTGIQIHGVVDSIHWSTRLSDPNPEVRAKGLAGLQTAIKDAAFYGGDTALLVPGKVTDPQNENYDQVYERSQAEVRKALPLAQETGVKIAIEVVWNDFITTPEQLIQYVDDFNSPLVGAYFDCSNMLKYGVPAATWIRKLGKRMLKFDFKGYSHSKKWVPIGEGDEDWPEVLKALGEIGYNGWATAEVGGGGEEKLREISERMDKVLGLKA